MARIVEIEKAKRDRVSLHDPVEAKCYLFETDGRKLIQIDTFGRSTREIPGKVSQSIQLDEQAARQLIQILTAHFGD